MRSSGSRSILAWVTAGFLAGSVFWHFVGFWDFVGRIVFNGPQHVTPAHAHDAGPTGPDRSVSSDGVSEQAKVSACVELLREPHSGETTALPCAPGPMPFQVGSLSSRGDLAISYSSEAQMTGVDELPYPTSMAEAGLEDGTRAEP